MTTIMMSRATTQGPAITARRGPIMHRSRTTLTPITATRITDRASTTIIRTETEGGDDGEHRGPQWWTAGLEAASAEPQRLHDVIGRLADRDRVIHRERPERRGPGH